MVFLKENIRSLRIYIIFFAACLVSLLILLYWLSKRLSSEEQGKYVS